MLALQTTKFEAARLAGLIITTFGASSMDELEMGMKTATAQIASLKAGLGQSTALLGSLGHPANLINSKSESFLSAAEKILAVAKDGGNIKALEVTGGAGRKPSTRRLKRSRLTSHSSTPEWQKSQRPAQKKRPSPRRC